MLRTLLSSLLVGSVVLTGCTPKNPVHQVRAFSLKGLSGIHLDGLRVTETKILADGTKVITESPVFTEIPIRDAKGNVVLGKDGEIAMVKIPMDLQYGQNIPVVIANSGGSWMQTLIAAGLSIHGMEAMKSIGSSALSKQPILDGGFEGNLISK
jgi:hypothetical protein